MLYGDGMIFETVKSGGISHNSYFLGSGGEAAVIDPRRDVDVYLDLAEGHGMNIRYIFETHRNEDYTIGSVELARYVDAEILHGSALDFRYGTAVVDGPETEENEQILHKLQVRYGCGGW